MDILTIWDNEEKSFKDFNQIVLWIIIELEPWKAVYMEINEVEIIITFQHRPTNGMKRQTITDDIILLKEDRLSSNQSWKKL